MAHNQCITTGPVGAAGTTYVDVGYAAGNCIEAAVTGKLVYGSGGTSIRVRLEGSYDAGKTWMPVGDMLFGTASAEKTFIVQSDSTDVFNPGDPLPDNTVRKALPPRLRVSKVVTGTYAGSTLDVWIGLKENAAFKLGQLDTDPAMAANSDARVPSQKAVKTRLTTAEGEIAVLPTFGDVTAALTSAVSAVPVSTELPDIPNLHAHWDAGSLGLADGARIASWLDEVASRDAAQATAGNQPAYVANAINGRPGVRFDNSRGDYLRATVAPGTANATIIAVMVAVSPASGSRYAIGTDNGARNIYRAVLGDVGIQGTAVIQANGVEQAPEIITGVYNTASSSIRVNGAVTPGDTQANGSPPANLTIGYRHSLAAGQGFDGLLCEVLYYSRVLSAGECEAIERYLGAKYGIGSAPQSTFYVDTVAGNDANTGRSAITPIKSWKRLTDGLRAAAPSVTDFTVFVTAPESNPLRPDVATNRNVLSFGKNVRMVPAKPGDRWYVYGSEKITGGWTHQGGGVYSHALTRDNAAGLVCWVPALLDGDGNPARCLKNAATQTAPAVGEYGWASNVYYVRLPGDANPNAYDVEIAVSGHTIARTITPGTLVIEDATLRGARGSGLYLNAGGTVRARRVDAEFCSDSGFALTGSTSSDMLCDHAVARFNGNDGFNLHGGSGIASRMTLVVCEGAWNYDEGASPHDDTIMPIAGGRFHHNGSGGITAVNAARLDLLPNEGAPVEVDHNRRLYIAAPGGGDRGGVVALDTVTANVYALRSHDNPGPGISRNATVTWNVLGTVQSGTAAGNGVADEVV